MSLVDYIGRDGSLLDETPQHAQQLKLESPILTNHELEKLRHVRTSAFRAITLPMWFFVDKANGLERAVVLGPTGTPRHCVAYAQHAAEQAGVRRSPRKWLMMKLPDGWRLRSTAWITASTSYATRRCSTQ